MAKRGRKKQDIELPVWFDLRKYERADSLTLPEWYDQFVLRHAAFHHNLCRRAFHETERELLDIIRGEGIPDPAKSEKVHGHLRVCAIPFKFHSGVTWVPVRELQHLQEEGYNLAAPWDRWTIWGHCSETVQIDLMYSDDALEGQFKEMLQAIRRERGGLEQMQVVATLWAKYGVLPCLDLHIWAQEEGAEFGTAQLARILFPEDREGARWRDVKKYTLAAMKRVMDSGYLRLVESRIRKG